MVFLPIVKLVLNKKVFNIIRIILFFIYFTKKFNLFKRLKHNSLVQSDIKKWIHQNKSIKIL